VWLKRN